MEWKNKNNKKFTYKINTQVMKESTAKNKEMERI
jgi:hypothetical protein